MTATLTKTTTDTVTEAQKAAEAYFTAKKVIDKITGSDEYTAAKNMQKAAIATLVDAYPVQSDHSKAKHPIVVFGNRTETFLHREDRSTSWKEAVNALRPDLTPEQSKRLDDLIAFHTGTRITKKFL
jgi:hypothetical protein